MRVCRRSLAVMGVALLVAPLYGISPLSRADVSTSVSWGGSVPRIIVDGIEKYQFTGAAAAIRIWLNLGDGKTSPDASNYVSILTQAESNYGKFVGYHTVSVVQISPTTSLAYLVLNYERGPLFARFTTYQYKSFQSVTQMDFSTKLEAVFPEKLQ